MIFSFEILFYISLAICLILLSVTIFNQRKYKEISKENLELKNRNTSENKDKRLKKMSLSLKQENVELEKRTIQELADLKLKHEKEINNLKEKNRETNLDEYNKGFENGVKQSAIDVQITPIKKVIDDKGMFSTKKSIQLGYSYRLFSHGIPCLEPHEVIVESISSSELNEENIKIAIEKIEDIIERIPNPSMQMVGSLKNFRKSLNKEVLKN